MNEGGEIECLNSVVCVVSDNHSVAAISVFRGLTRPVDQVRQQLGTWNVGTGGREDHVLTERNLSILELLRDPGRFISPILGVTGRIDAKELVTGQEDLVGDFLGHWLSLALFFHVVERRTEMQCVVFQVL